MMPFFTEEWGNPSSSYRFGARAKAAVNQAREHLAKLVGADATEVVFTSCATEANNAAINSALLADPTKRHVVTSRVEHSSVLHYCEELVQRGYEVTFLPVSREGELDLTKLEQAIRPDTAVVSIMWANNETGVISPVRDIGKICARHRVLFHCDSVQAVGKIAIDFASTPVQFLSLSGHKIGAPKGVGALLVREGVPYRPLIIGGKQETGRRGGTESVPLIVGLGEACRVASERSVSKWEKVARLRDELENRLLAAVPDAYINGSGLPRMPNTVNFGVRGVDSDTFLTYCDRNEICISSGSACMESAITPSHVILAMTQNHERSSEAVRVSLGISSSQADIDVLLTHLIKFLAITH